MGTSTTNRNDLLGVSQSRVQVPVAASTKIVSGVLVCTNAAGDAVPAADSADLYFFGLSESLADNSAGSAGDTSVLVTPVAAGRLGCIQVNAVSPDRTWIGQDSAAVDDHTVALLSQVAHVVRTGRIVDVVATGTSGKVIIDTTDRTTSFTGS